MQHEKVLRSIELFGTKVAPIVRREVERGSVIAMGAAGAPTPSGAPAPSGAPTPGPD